MSFNFGQQGQFNFGGFDRTLSFSQGIGENKDTVVKELEHTVATLTAHLDKLHKEKTAKVSQANNEKNQALARAAKLEEQLAFSKAREQAFFDENGEPKKGDAVKKALLEMTNERDKAVAERQRTIQEKNSLAHNQVDLIEKLDSQEKKHAAELAKMQAKLNEAVQNKDELEALRSAKSRLENSEKASNERIKRLEMQLEERRKEVEVEEAEVEEGVAEEAEANNSDPKRLFTTQDAAMNELMRQLREKHVTQIADGLLMRSLKDRILVLEADCEARSKERESVKARYEALRRAFEQAKRRYNAGDEAVFLGDDDVFESDFELTAVKLRPIEDERANAAADLAESTKISAELAALVKDATNSAMDMQEAAEEAAEEDGFEFTEQSYSNSSPWDAILGRFYPDTKEWPFDTDPPEPFKGPMVDSGTQTEPIKILEAGTQTDTVRASEAGTQTHSVGTSEAGVPKAAPLYSEAGTQTTPAQTSEAGVQTAAPKYSDSGTQTTEATTIKPPQTSEAGFQTSRPQYTESGTQTANTSSSLPQTADAGVQISGPHCSNSAIQPIFSQTADTGVQTSGPRYSHSTVQTIFSQATDAGVQPTITVPQTADAGVQISRPQHSHSAIQTIFSQTAGAGVETSFPAPALPRPLPSATVLVLSFIVFFIVHLVILPLLPKSDSTITSSGYAAQGAYGFGGAPTENAWDAWVADVAILVAETMSGESILQAFI